MSFKLLGSSSIYGLLLWDPEMMYWCGPEGFSGGMAPVPPGTNDMSCWPLILLYIECIQAGYAPSVMRNFNSD